MALAHVLSHKSKPVLWVNVIKATQHSWAKLGLGSPPARRLGEVYWFCWETILVYMAPGEPGEELHMLKAITDHI